MLLFILYIPCDKRCYVVSCISFALSLARWLFVRSDLSSLAWKSRCYGLGGVRAVEVCWGYMRVQAIQCDRV